VSENSTSADQRHLEELYREAEYWQVNTGGKTIHAKRMPGMYRRYKWIAMTVWLSFFLGPYMRWNHQQAILFDIPERKFHLFAITILPQDVWMLALVLLFFALLLAAVTSAAGRVYCGYFCFQTVWTDIFTWIESKLEGAPVKRAKLDQAAWTLHKFRIKFIKHLLWLIIGVFTGISFTLWFGDAYTLWQSYLHLQAPSPALIAIAVFTFFTYLFAAHMREQVCFWLCPYARIQGVMYDRQTILPTYDFSRGEPRGKLKKHDLVENKSDSSHATQQGDCIDCRQCVAVCPTGIDIRTGQQEGCITCALCIDACDAVMDKIHKPLGLIRYASLDEIEHNVQLKFWRRPRILMYLFIMLAAVIGIIYGLTHLGSVELKVLHERQPLYVLRSDGSIQNKYTLKILNKTEHPLQLTLTVAGHDKLSIFNSDTQIEAKPGDVTAHTLFLQIPRSALEAGRVPVTIHLQDTQQADIVADYQSMFFGPEPLSPHHEESNHEHSPHEDDEITRSRHD